MLIYAMRARTQVELCGCCPNAVVGYPLSVCLLRVLWAGFVLRAVRVRVCFALRVVLCALCFVRCALRVCALRVCFLCCLVWLVCASVRTYCAECVRLSVRAGHPYPPTNE